jgi:hypothetical protein
MANRSFAASIEAFAEKTEAQMQAVMSESIQDAMDIMQTPVANGGRMPVDDGHLINSVVTELNGSQIGRASEAADKGGASSTANIALLVTQMKIGDVARIGWSAAHAMRQHEGFVGEDALGRSFNQEGKFWIDGAAAQWPQIIARNVGRLK